MAEVLWTLLVLLLFCLEFWKPGSVLLTAEVFGSFSLKRPCFGGFLEAVFLESL